MCERTRTQPNATKRTRTRNSASEHKTPMTNAIYTEIVGVASGTDEESGPLLQQRAFLTLLEG